MIGAGAAGLATDSGSAAVGARGAARGSSDRACKAGSTALAEGADMASGEVGGFGSGLTGGGDTDGRRSTVAVANWLWLVGDGRSISSDNPIPKNTIIVAMAAIPSAPRDKIAPASWRGRMRLSNVDPEGDTAVGRDAPNAAGWPSREPDRSRSVRLRMPLFLPPTAARSNPQRILDLQKGPHPRRRATCSRRSFVPLSPCNPFGITT